MANILRRPFLILNQSRRFHFRDKLPLIPPGFVSQRKKIISIVLFTGAAAGTGFYCLQSDKKRRAILTSIGGILRFYRSSFIASSIAFDYYWSTFGILESSDQYIKVLSRVHKRSAKKILKGCLQNGGLYIKLGQGLVIMDHILPKEYIDELRILQDQCLIRDVSEIHQVFKEDFGKNTAELFESFNETAVAAASLAQVFKATTKDGKEIAVKVQYLDLQDRFIGDIATLNILLHIAAKFHPDFDFVWVLNELKGTLEKELNFLNEGKNSERCANDLKHLSFVHVPKVDWDLCSTRVLTTEYIEGVKISDLKGLKKIGISLADVDKKLFKAFSEQIFYSGFVHADPHAGNILIRKTLQGAELVILDHGLYENVPSHISSSLRNLWKSMVLNDHENMKKYSMELGIKEADYRLFCIALGQRYIPAPAGDKSDSDIIRMFFSPQKITKMKKWKSKQERIQLQRELQALRNRSFAIFKDMPNKLMLVTRMVFGLKAVFNGISQVKLVGLLKVYGKLKKYKLLCEILTQMPQSSGGLNINLARKLTTKDLRLLILRAQTNFDDIMNILKQLPSPLILIIRNINTIRSIAKEHGDPINRYKEMARCATYSSFQHEKGIVATLKSFCEITNFEIKLWWGGVKSWWLSMIIKVLTIGISEDEGATPQKTANWA